MLAANREEISKTIVEAEERISSVHPDELSRDELIYATNLLCVYMVTTLEYCLKTAFELDLKDQGWQNHFKYICDQAGRYGYRETVKKLLSQNKHGRASFESLVFQRNNYIHRRMDVSASIPLLKEYFEHAREIVSTIAETMPDRHVFKADAEGRYISDIKVDDKIDLERLVEPLVKTFSSSELPNLELVIRIQNKKIQEENN